MAWGPQRTIRVHPLLIALLAVALALAVRALLDPIIPHSPPFASFLFAVAVAAYYGGTSAGIAAILLSLPLGVYFFVEPRFTFTVAHWSDLLRLALFAGFALALTFFAGRIRQTQQEAERSRQRLSLALAAGGLGIWDWDVVEDALVWGEGFAELNGRDAAATPRTFAEFLQLIHPEDRKAVEAAILAALNQDAPYDIEFRTVWPDGSVHWAVRRGVVLRDDKGRPLRMLGVGADITRRKTTEAALRENEAQLRRYNEQLEQFAYAAAHDLQEPLRSVSIFSEMLLRRLGNNLDPQSHEFLEHVNKGAQRMSTLITDLLRYTTAVDKEANLGVVDCGEAARQAIQELAPLIAHTGAQIELGALPRVHGFQPHLLQLFQNLLANSLKYRDADRTPQIRISAERRDREWVLSVADNGIGIHPDYHERIFGVFKRLHRHDQIEGTGIGLAITKRIVEHHGGRIWVESAEGQGACFRFTLPDSSAP